VDEDRQQGAHEEEHADADIRGAVTVDGCSRGLRGVRGEVVRRHRARNRAESCDAHRPADLLRSVDAGGRRPGISVLDPGGRGPCGGGDDQADPRTDQQQAGQQVGGVVRGDAQADQQQRADAGHDEPQGHREACGGSAREGGADGHGRGHQRRRDRQERDTRDQLGVAQRGLEVERQEQEGREQPGGCQQQRDQCAPPGAVEHDPQREQGRARADLDDHEDHQKHGSGEEVGDGRGRRPAGGPHARGPEHEREEPGRDGDRTRDVQPLAHTDRGRRGDR
jgi:hypothetical protein